MDASFEKLLFRFFVDEYENLNSIQGQIYHDIVQHVRPDTPWHKQRGEDGLLTQLDQPLVHEGPPYVDSGQLLAAIFCSVNELSEVVGYANFWLTFINYAEDELARGESATLDAIRSGAPIFAGMAGAAVQQEGAALLIDC